MKRLLEGGADPTIAKAGGESPAAMDRQEGKEEGHGGGVRQGEGRLGGRKEERFGEGFFLSACLSHRSVRRTAGGLIGGCLTVLRNGSADTSLVMPFSRFV